MMNGIINIYKEAGYTSHDVVAKMRGILKQKKIGHTGTLDPDAVGVLPVCLGNGTRLCDMLTDKSKEYEAVLQLGVTTDTQDMSGTVLTQSPVAVTEDEVRQAVLSFVGAYEQVPPMYSALKVNGKKLYELAREGKEIERKARSVTIHNIEILKMELPKITFRVQCSKGTYIRTLCYDIGSRLGCGGAMASLKRTGVGMFRIENAITLAQLEQLREEGQVERYVIATDQVLSDYPAVYVREEFERLLENGNAFYGTQLQYMAQPGNLAQVRVYGSTKRFYGIYVYHEEEDRYKPVKMFLG